MSLSKIDIPYIGIAILFTLYILIDQKYYSNYINTVNNADSIPDTTKTMKQTFMNVIVYLFILIAWYMTRDYFENINNINNINTKFLVIGVLYTLILLGYEHYINSNNIHEQPTLVGIKTVINVFFYMGLLLTWYFTKQAKDTNNPTILITIGYAAATLLFSGLGLYVIFDGLEHIIEKGIVPSEKDMNTNKSKKDYCPDFCNWFTTKDQCSKNKTWNGLTCAWNAGKKLCYTPEDNKPWARNIFRTLIVIFSLMILLLLFFSFDKIVNSIKQYPNLVWLLEIPMLILKHIEKYKRDINITTPTTWILIVIELFILGLYFFANYFAYNAYEKYGFVIQDPPLGLSYKTTVGCKALNQIHTNQSTHTDAVDKNVSFTIEKGSLTNFLPVTEDVKQQIIDANDGPIPKETYTLTTDFIIHRDNTTKTYKQTNSINYNYGISLWIYIDPHQPGNIDNWYSFFSFDFKPNLLYNPKSNAMKISVQENTTKNTNIYDSIKDSKPVKDIPLQKWNHLFINNMGSKCDLFLNGTLVTSIRQAIPKNKTNKITTGSPKGIVGRICNIFYFNKSLYGTQIVDIYNKYKNYDPPSTF